MKNKSYLSIPTISLMLVSAAVLSFFSAYVWYNTSYTDKENVFWGAIDDSLQIGTISKRVVVDNGVERTEQIQTTSYDVEPRTVNRVNITRQPQSAEEDPESIDIRTLGYFDRDYLIYDQISVNDEASQTTVQDAVGLWAFQDADNGGEPELLDESLLGSFVLFGGFDRSTRTDIVNLLRDNDAYVVDYDSAIEEERVVFNDQDGNELKRDVYVYDVGVDLEKFKPALTEYLVSFNRSDLAEEIAQSAGALQANMTLVIDAKTRSVLEVTLNGNTETYVGHGVFAENQRPDSNTTYEQLNELLST